MKVNEILKNLIQIQSFSNEENKVCDYIFNFLTKEGFDVEKQEVDSDGYNIIAKKGIPKIYFSAHLDTVKPYIEFSEDENNIYGRGACDTKGSAAAMIKAALDSKDYNNFGLIFTVGEEVDFRGVSKIKELNYKIPFVVIGEPTNLDIVNKHYGFLGLKIITKGKSAHSSNPELGENAIEKMIDILSNLKKMEIGSESSMNIATIKGGVADNIVPDSAECEVSFRTNPDDEINYYEKVKELANNLGIVEIVLDLKQISCEVPKELSFIENVKTVKYGTELYYFENGVVLGPGDIKYAHKENEQISKKELNNAVEIYKKIIQNYSNN